MAAKTYQEIKDTLRQLYIEDRRPWLVGFSALKTTTTSLPVDEINRQKNLSAVYLLA